MSLPISIRICISTACLLLLPLAAKVEAGFTISETPGEHVDVAYNGRVVFRLMTANDTSTEARAHETYKVYAHVMDPLDPENKRTLTKGAGHKFTHHRGIFVGWAKANVDGVGGVDTWHMKNGVRQHFAGIAQQEAGDEAATFTANIQWVKGDDLLLSEQRSFVIHSPEESGAILIDTFSTVLASTGKTELKGDPEHAGLQFRAHEAVAQNKSASYLFPDGMKPGKNGDPDIPWAAMSFKIDDRDYHVQHMSHPSLPKGNIYSAYRDYGRFGAYFVKTVEKNETATFHVRFYISPGTFPADAESAMQTRYDEYVKAVK